MSTHHHLPRSQSRPSGFTLVELVVVMGIIALLVSVLVIAVSGARESARGASTATTMNSMSQGMVAFREDVGYLPPLLDESRSLMQPPPLDDGNIFERMQGYYSITTPAEYLLGYGGHGMDGYGWDPQCEVGEDYGPPGSSSVSIQDESERWGIRNPGPDGVWTSTYARADKGTLSGRVERFAAGKVSDNGPLLGPYMALPGRGVIGRLVSTDGVWDGTSIDAASGQPAVLFEGDEGYDQDPSRGAHVICDAWGTPIRFYRLNYPGNNPAQRYPATKQPYCPTMSQFIALRPWDFEPGSSTEFLVPSGDDLWGDYNATMDGKNRKGDSLTSYELQSGEFAFLSAGPDRRINNWQRNDAAGVGGNDGSSFNDDWHYNWGSIPGSSPQYPVPETEEVNRDNIVEVGS